MRHCFNLVHKHGKTKAKNKNGTNVPDPGKLVHSSSVIAFQIARVIRCSVVDIKRTGDMSPLKRIRLRSHEGENEGETDRCVLESGERMLV